MQTVDFGIICALEEEFDAVVRHFPLTQEGELGIYKYTLGSVRRNRKGYEHLFTVAIVCIQSMGNLKSLDATHLLIRCCHPRFVILSGICGGITNAVNDYQLGDVVVANHVVYYEPAKVRPDSSELRPHDLISAGHDGDAEAGSVLLQEARGIFGGAWVSEDSIQVEWPVAGKRHKPVPKVGKVASGEKVIADGARAEEIGTLSDDIISIEMESAGVAHACCSNGIPFLVVKSVSDFADDHKDHVHSYREYACATAASFVFHLIEHMCKNETLLGPRTDHSQFGELLRLIPNSDAIIILPSYKALLRHGIPMTNYPYTEYATAYDDMDCTFRIMPELSRVCGTGTVNFQLSRSRGAAIVANKIYIGSTISNSHTRNALKKYNAFFKFGNGDDAHAIAWYDDRGEICARKEMTNKIGDEGHQLYGWVEDYALISAFRSAAECTIILAGCRAYGQLCIGEFLANKDYIGKLQFYIPEGDFQCILKVDVTEREQCFTKIEHLVMRPPGKKSFDDWKVISLPSKLFD